MCATEATGFYWGQIARFKGMYDTTPVREAYEVAAPTEALAELMST